MMDVSVVERRHENGVWSVEAIADGEDGSVYQAHFHGPRSEERAREYASLKYGFAEVTRLTADYEDAFARGFSAGQHALKDVGKLVIQDSPELAILRDDVARLTSELATMTAERDGNAYLKHYHYGQTQMVADDLRESEKARKAAEAALATARADGVAEGLRMAVEIVGRPMLPCRTGGDLILEPSTTEAIEDALRKLITATAPTKPAGSYSEGVAAGMQYGEAIAIAAIKAMPGAGPFRLSGKDDDWRFRAALARKEALDAAGAYVRVAFEKAALTPTQAKPADGWQPIATCPNLAGSHPPVDLWSKQGFRMCDCQIDVVEYRAVDDPRPDRYGWTDANGHGSIEDAGPFTHWRLLPAPPAPPEGGEG